MVARTMKNKAEKEGENPINIFNFNLSGVHAIYR